MRTPLAGKTIVLTRPRAQSAELAARLERLGGRVVLAPTIKIAPPSSHAALDAALRRFSDFDAVAFTSRNAVDAVFARAKILRLTLERPRRLLAVGPATARALADRGWRGARTAGEFRGDALARAAGVARGDRVLIPRAKDGRDELPRALRRAGARVTLVEAYRTLPDRSCERRLKAAVRRGIDAVVFTSGSTARHFSRLVGRAAARRLFARAAAASIGPTTSAELRALGIAPAVEARPSTAAGVVAALRREFASREGRPR